MTRQGLTRQLALITVSAVAQQAKRNLESVGIDGLDWLQEISDAAECRLPAPAPTVTDQEGSEHGNGSSS